MRKLLKVFKIRIVAASHKALMAVYVDHEMLVKFFRQEVFDEADAGKKETARKLLRKLVRHGFVARFLAFLDITHALTKASCNSQNNVLSILELEHLNQKLFDDLAKLAETKILAGNRLRFGKYLRQHGKELYDGKFVGVELFYKPKTQDWLSPIRNLQHKFGALLLSKY